MQVLNDARRRALSCDAKGRRKPANAGVGCRKTLTMLGHSERDIEASGPGVEILAATRSKPDCGGNYTIKAQFPPAPELTQRKSPTRVTPTLHRKT